MQGYERMDKCIAEFKRPNTIDTMNPRNEEKENIAEDKNEREQIMEN